ncbi:MAG TPA: ATPase, T2SS/T4P/T4SS family [Polyangiaceae bacterium]|nr:ATPase, T2SS/T4P/T4SS family [Polyangiaceae bacterium]
MSGARLELELEGPNGRERLTLPGAGPWWIGRDRSCQVVLNVPSISRRHIGLELVSDGLQVTDGSSNGSIVNELLLRQSSRVIPDGQATLQVGPYQMRVRPAGSWTPAATPVATTSAPAAESPGVDARRRMHRRLLENLDLPSLDRSKLDPEVMRPKVIDALRRIVAEAEGARLAAEAQETLVRELTDEALGLGPLEQLLADPDVNEIMVVDPHTIFVERRGKMQLTGLTFTDDDSVRAAIERIVTPLGRRIDESTPLVDARLRDGSRVNAVIPPLALRGPCITIRKFAKDPLRMPDLVRFGSVNEQMARFLERAVKVKKNIVISGGTGSGKTTLLNVLSGAIPSHERVVTVEDAAELQLAQPHVVSLEARPPNLEGKGEYSIRDLVKNALRMRPDRIVVGECRGGEAIDMLQAMNTGHEGSMTTTHANSPREAIARLETLCLMAGLDLPVRAIRQQIASSIHLIVQQSRFSDGSRRVTSITEILGVGDDGDVEHREIFGYKVVRTKEDGVVQGEFGASGYLPSFLDQFVTHGLVENGVAL